MLCCAFLPGIIGQMPHETGSINEPGKMYFRHLTRESGLPSNNIRWISSDFLGYVWIATDNGVVRYDGLKMRVFQYVPGEAYSIAESAATVILQSQDSMIWIGTKNGISVFNPFNETFSNHQFITGDPAFFPGDWVASLYDDGNGYIWIGTNNGLIKKTMLLNISPCTGSTRVKVRLREKACFDG